MNEKKKAWGWMSKYVRLRDSIEYCKQNGLDLDLGVAQCCTCGMVISWKNLDAGHFIGRGSGGGSGVYFDERNAHAQCGQCNAFKQGSPKEYEDFMRIKYGQNVIDELGIKDKTNIYKARDFVGMGLMYRELYEELLEGLK